MKKVIFLMAFGILSFCQVMNAQICDGVTAQAVPMVPQDPTWDDYGVRVTLSKTASTEVSVQGYIHDEASISSGYPFHVTISPGSTEAQTGTGDFHFERSTNVTVTVASVYPCPTNNNTGQWTYYDAANGVNLTYDFELLVNGNDSALNVNLTINDNLIGTVAFGQLSLSSQNYLDTAALSNILSTRYSSLFSTYGKNTLMKYSMSLQLMISTLTGNEFSLPYQALRMYKTIAQGAKRDANNSGSVDFTVSNGYIGHVCSFIVEEDFYLNISDFKNYLLNRQLTDSTNVGISYYLGALENETADSLNMKQITQRLNAYFQTQFAHWPQGGECGCCGNYEGGCYYWNKICLAHDMACQRCQWDACLPGCKPTSCSGNTIKWYWWLVMS